MWRTGEMQCLEFGWDRVSFHKKLGWDTAGTVGSNEPREYWMPCEVMLSI